jgi:hypothetical protein
MEVGVDPMAMVSEAIEPLPPLLMLGIREPVLEIRMNPSKLCTAIVDLPPFVYPRDQDHFVCLHPEPLGLPSTGYRS